MKTSLCSVLSLCACLSATSGEFAFHFNTPEDFKLWQISSKKLEPLTPAKEYSIFEANCLRFKTPKWEKGMPEWPSCQAKPLIADWTPYDRLLLDISNPHPESQRLSLFISDSKIPFRKALGDGFTLDGNSCTRCVVQLSKFPKTVDRKDISILHLFTQRPSADMDIFIADAILLKKGEKLPEIPSAFIKKLLPLNIAAFDKVKKAADKTIQELEVLCDRPELRNSLANVKRSISLRIGNLERKLLTKDLTMEQYDELRIQLAEMPETFKRLPSIIKFQRDSILAGFDNPKMLVGTASSMVKVLPRDMPFDVQVVKTIELSLARHEWESVQIAVMPRGNEELKNVTIAVTPLKDGKGHTLEKVDTDTVGFVKTEKRPPYTVSYVGWWPDPILRGCENVTIKPHDIQTFWLRFHAETKQAAGIYKGKLTVRADGAAPVTLDLQIRVRDFNVPANTALPTAITFGFNNKQCCVKEDYDTMKFKYSDFLADYQIDYDHLYRQGPPDFDIIQRLHKQGRLTAFNLGNVFNGGVDEKDFEKKMQETIERIHPAYEKAKELGLLEYAYIYGFDERGKDQFPILERCAQALRTAFPEVLLMTTSYDDTYGTNSVVKTMDAWCPLTPVYQKTVDKIPAARTAGKYVWWYICCGPHNPFTNWFVEYAAIESRLLMGAQTAKFRPDGFLYYHTSIWNNNKGIDCAAGPYTSWNPVSWTVYHGDGSLFHCDSDGNPLPSIRLENYRDGQEDYAYYCILEDAIKQVKTKKNLTAAQAKWLKEAEAALVVPETLVKGMDIYSHDPQQLRTWRDHLGDLIEACGFSANINPWGKGVFGVRGWRK
ncbi:MAG: DUF4091 domain-containing protein [Victivallales bacterium]|nr:DUF4091 domain-containing protein [Victivallales bacterium]